MLLATLAGILAGTMTGQASDQPSAFEPALASLLRFMALVKAATAGVMLVLTAWRLRQPATPGFALTYTVAVCLAAAAPGLIWSLSLVAAGAALFHLGLAIGVVAAWRDGTVRHPLRRDR